MKTILDFLPDKTFLNQAFSYLESFHEIHALVIDNEGGIHLLEGQKNRKFKQNKHFPVKYQENIGGIQCSAESADALAKAEPHIQICIAGIETILGKDLVVQQTMEEMLHLSDQLHFLFTLANKISGIPDIQQYCTLVLQEISQEISADSAFVQMNNSKGQKRIIFHKLSEQDIEKVERDPAIQELSEGKTAIVSLQDGRTVLVIPIKEKEMYNGRMVLLKNRGKRTFTAYEKQFVGIINNIISPTVESLSLYSSLQVLYMNTVKALAAAIDAKDAYTHGHSFRVARFSVAIGKRLNIPPEQLQQLETAAYMHDLGKIGVPESILGKPGRLSPNEFMEIKKHPILTNKILEPIDLPDFIVDATLQHHERLDGQGYPLGLKGNEISLFARIIAVADVFDALTSARPYRGALTVEDALTTICDGIDSEYDRNVVHAFIDAIQDYSKDQDIAEVYSELEFMRPERFNDFLEKLTQVMVTDTSNPLGSASSDPSLVTNPG